MLAVRCSFKPEMHQFHSFHKFLYTLPHSQLEKSEGIIPRCSFLSESEGSWHWQNKEQLSGKYVYIYIFVHFGDTRPGIYITRLVIFQGFIIFSFY